MRPYLRPSYLYPNFIPEKRNSDRAENLRGDPVNIYEYAFFKGANVPGHWKKTAMNTLLPPLRSWSKNLTNRCSCEEVPVYWEAYDVITFLADLRMYRPSLYDLLDSSEKDREQKFKTEYFKKRFTLSRSLLKHILQPVLNTCTPSDILLGKERKGRVTLHGRPDIWISLSYSGPCIAITLGKQKIGCDIEVVRPVKAHKIVTSRLFSDSLHAGDREFFRTVIHGWTLVESYAKLYDENPYLLLNSCSLSEDTNFVSYCINNHLILTLASGKKQITDILVWLDMNNTGEASRCTGTY
jgi:4'-phosphopantetheinyl transferase